MHYIHKVGCTSVKQVPVTGTCSFRLTTQIWRDLCLSETLDPQVIRPVGFPRIYLCWPTGYPDLCSALDRSLGQSQRLVRTLPNFVIDSIHYCYVPTLPTKPSASYVRWIQVCSRNNACRMKVQSEWPTLTISDMLAGKPIGTLSECSISILIIEWTHSNNVRCAVQQTKEYTKWIFHQYEANPIVDGVKIQSSVRLIRQYTDWICSQCPANATVHWVNIQLASG